MMIRWFGLVLSLVVFGAYETGAQEQAGQTSRSLSIDIHEVQEKINYGAGYSEPVDFCFKPRVNYALVYSPVFAGEHYRVAWSGFVPAWLRAVTSFDFELVAVPNHSGEGDRCYGLQIYRGLVRLYEMELASE